MHHSLKIMFILPLMTRHLFWKATILGGLYRGVLLYYESILKKNFDFQKFALVWSAHV